MKPKLFSSIRASEPNERNQSNKSQNSLHHVTSVNSKLPKITNTLKNATKESPRERVPVGERYIDSNSKVYGLKTKQQN